MCTIGYSSKRCACLKAESISNSHCHHSNNCNNKDDLTNVDVRFRTMFLFIFHWSMFLFTGHQLFRFEKYNPGQNFLFFNF